MSAIRLVKPPRLHRIALAKSEGQCDAQQGSSTGRWYGQAPVQRWRDTVLSRQRKPKRVRR
jgi:hypothetical protein